MQLDKSRSSSLTQAGLLGIVSKLAAVNRACQSLTSMIELAELIPQLAQVFLHYTQSECALVLLPELEQFKTQFKLKAIADSTQTEICDRFLIPGDLIEPELIAVITQTQQAVCQPDSATSANIGLPLLLERQLLGIIYLQNCPVNHKLDLATPDLDYICSQAAIALNHANLYAAERAKNWRLSKTFTNIVFDQAAVGVAQSQMQTGKLTDVNEYFCQMLGYEMAELEQMTVADITHPDDMGESYDSIQQLLSGKITNFTVEKRYIRQNSSCFWSATTVSLVKNFDEAEAQCCLAIIKDISEQKQAEAALISKQNHLEVLLNNIPHMVWLKDIDSRFIAVNQAFAETATRPIAEIVGKTDRELWTPELAQQYRQDDLEVLAVRQRKIAEEKISTSGESYAWIETTKTPFYKVSGELAGTVGIAVDVTNYKNSQTQLYRSQQLLKLVLDTISHPVFWKDRDSVYLGCNQKFADVTGLNSPEEIVGKTDFDLPWKPEEAAFFVECDRRILASGQAELNIVESQFNANHMQTWIKTNKSPLRDADGEVIGILGAYHDITQEKIAAEAIASLNEDLERRVSERTAALAATNQALIEAKRVAELANQAKSEFLSCMSHELRTPLNAILGFTQIMQRDLTANPEQLKKLDIVSRSGEHLLALINDILDMSKIEAGQIELTIYSFDLYELLDTTVEMLRLKADSKGLELVFARHPQTPRHIRADGRKLSQVLINLLNNAFKFTERGRVSLTVVPDAENPYILNWQIEDTGVGIAAAELESLFEPFAQADAGKQTTEGTGLGLAISQKFVQLMGGDITVDSKLNLGTKFTFSTITAPAIKSELQAYSPNQKIIGLESDQPSYRILVVDDIWKNRHIVCQLLESVGFMVEEAQNGQEAIEIWSRWQPDLIWMDVKMPVMDGYEATQWIKSQSRPQNTHIIALTASTFEEEKAIVLAAGCDDFVRKPLQESILFDKMAQYLGVRYVYADRSAPDLTNSPLNLDSNSLTVMPDHWLSQLEQAAITLDQITLVNLLNQIPDEYQDLTKALQSQIDDFAFDEMANLVRQVFD